MLPALLYTWKRVLILLRTLFGFPTAEMSTHNDATRDMIEEREIRIKAYRWCKDSIGGAWSKLSPEELVMEHVR